MAATSGPDRRVKEAVVAVRLARDEHAQLVARAAEEKVSIGVIIRRALSNELQTA